MQSRRFGTCLAAIGLPILLAPLAVAQSGSATCGKLARTPGGLFIIGLSTVNNNAQTIVFVYEVYSGSVLRSRTVTGQSTVPSVSPERQPLDGGLHALRHRHAERHRPVQGGEWAVPAEFFDHHHCHLQLYTEHGRQRVLAGR